jgi:hypothetical protein
MTFHARDYSGLARPNFVSAITSERPMSTGGFSVMRALYRGLSGDQSRERLHRTGVPLVNSNPPQKESR